MPDVETSKEDRHHFTSLPLVQREVALVLVLCFISGGLYAATKSIADWSRRSSARDAAFWYQQGQTLVGQGRTEQGIAALRRAVVGNRQSPLYQLALARALTQGNDVDEARQLLLRLRDTEPDDAEVNYLLAQLAEKGGDRAEAERYFNLAIYSLTPSDPRYNPLNLREQLADFLLKQGDTAKAINELNALVPELPDQPDEHLKVARLFERAGDEPHALVQYARAAQLDPGSRDALVGAGEAAYAQHDFASAERYLQQAGRIAALTDPARAHLQTAQLIEAADPLASGLTMTERVDRLRAGLARVSTRLDGCAAAAGAAAPDPLRADLQAFSRRPRESLRDTDVLTRGVDLVARASAEAGTRCGSRDAADDAWILIGQVHTEVRAR
jgi:Tfp pilus assembly protein PilF